MQIWKQYDKKLKREFWRARFELNGKTFRVKETTRDEMEKTIAEIRVQEKTEQDNKKYNFNKEVPSYVPTVEEIFKDALPKIISLPQRNLSERVFELFLLLSPSSMKVNELKTRHFQIYADHRRGQLGVQTKKPIKDQTILKELNAMRSVLRKSARYYDSLENWKLPDLPEMQKGLKRKGKRARLVSDKELSAIIAALMKEPTGKQAHTRFHRERLAHTLEFAYWTGLRRKEISRLRFSQYNSEQQAILNLRRWKTDSVTKFFPLGKRAIEIIETRRELQKDSDYIFTPDGEPVEANYRTLKNICKDLEIPYGRYSENGFISHDLRHNFGTEILRETDIETARELLGHSNIAETRTYVHTSNERLREAIRKRDKIDYDAELKQVFAAVKTGELDEQGFIAKLKQILVF